MVFDGWYYDSLYSNPFNPNKEIDKDKQDAYNTLFTVLTTMCEVIAPLMLFTTEYVWRGLNN